MQGDTVDKDTEWPTLNEVASKNCTDGRRSRNVRTEPKDSNSNGATGYDSSKENKGETLNNSGARKKKKPTKISWQPLHIEPQPYKKRGNGRHGNEYIKSTENKKNRNHNEYGTNGFENGRGNNRNGGFKGRRGRAYFGYRSRREDESFLSEGQTNGILINGVTFFPQLFSDDALKDNIKHQMEYYFSNANLYRDVYLRRNMDNEGFVPLALFLTFPRIMRLTNDINIVIEALQHSDKLELQGDYIRRVVDPLGWQISYNFHDVSKTAADDSDSNSVPLHEGNSSIVLLNEGDSIMPLNDDLNIAPLNEDDPCVAPLIDKIENLDLNGASSFPQIELDVQYSPDISKELTASASSPELDIELNGVYIDNAVINSSDYYSHTSSPLEQDGFQFFTEAVYNNVIFYDSNNLSNHNGTYYFSNPSEVLSNSDNSSTDGLHNMSPEPSR